jgi:hypothetical protein
MTTLFKCRNVLGVGAEQMLLDMQSVCRLVMPLFKPLQLRGLLLELPSLDHVDKVKPANYTRYVTKAMQKAELIPKVIMTPHDDPRLFVEDFNLKVGRFYCHSCLMCVQLVGEDLTTFRNVLEMKGIRKADQGPFVDLFKGMAPTPAPSEATSDKLQQKSTASSALAGAARATTAVKSRITSGIQKANVDKILRRFKDKKDEAPKQ